MLQPLQWRPRMSPSAESLRGAWAPFAGHPGGVRPCVPHVRKNSGFAIASLVAQAPECCSVHAILASPMKQTLRTAEIDQNQRAGDSYCCGD